MWDQIKDALRTDAIKVLKKGAISLSTSAIGCGAAAAVIPALAKLGITVSIDPGKVKAGALIFAAGLAGSAWNWATHRGLPKPDAKPNS